MTDFITLIQNSIDSHPGQIALTEYPGGEITYSELGDAIVSLQKEWSAVGLQKGDHIAICAENSIHWVEVFLAAVMGGYVAVLLQANSVDESNISSYLDHSDARLLYTNDGIAAAVDYKSVRTLQAVADIKSLSVITERNETDHGPLDTELHLDEIGISNLSEVCVILYTSGSTGKPKGVALTYSNISYTVSTTIPSFPYDSDGTQVIMLPLSHIYGLMCDFLCPLCLNMHLILLTCVPSCSNISNSLQIFHPSVFFTVPLVVNGLVSLAIGKERYRDIFTSDAIVVQDEFKRELVHSLSCFFGANLKLLVTGGSVAESKMEHFLVNELSFPYVTGYGCSECGILSAGQRDRYSVGSCGILFNPDSVRVAVTNEISQSGKIQIKCEGVFCGYYKDCDATSKSFTNDGWYQTGDFGKLGEDNSLYVFCRIDNVIVLPNGVNIYPEHVERLINKSDLVLDSAVFLKDKELHAVVVVDNQTLEKLSNNNQTTIISLERHMVNVNHKLPGHLVISDYHFTNQPLRRTNKGEIDRREY